MKTIGGVEPDWARRKSIPNNAEMALCRRKDSPLLESENDLLIRGTLVSDELILDEVAGWVEGHVVLSLMKAHGPTHLSVLVNERTHVDHWG